MTRDKIKEDLNNIFRDIFEDAHINVTDETTAKEVERWDSVSHIDMICMVEDAFKVKLTTKEVSSLKNVGDLISVIERKVQT
jgi:acyl carrier protein